MKGQDKMNVSMKWRLALAATAFAMLPVSVMAQGYYDDDIYYDESKAKAKKTQTVTTKPAARPAAKPVATIRVERDVDEYNRRGSYKPVDNQTVDDLGDNFEYTRRIERFYNQDIVNQSGDDDLVYYYTNANDELANVNSSAPTTINIYVDNPDPWDGFWNPYYYSSAWSWAWRPTYYNPWYSWNYAWGYGPTWSWSWGWGSPSFSWSWSWGWGWNTPSYGWGWNPAWGWNHPGPGWGGGHHHPNYPGNNWGYNHPRPAGPGASRPSARPGFGNVATANRNPQRPTQNGTLSRNNSARGGRTPLASDGNRNIGGRPSSAGNANAGNASGGNSTRGTRGTSARRGYNPSEQTRPGSPNLGSINRGTSDTNRGTATSNRGTASSNRGTATSNRGTASSSSSRNSGRASSGSSSRGSSYNSGSSSRGSNYGSGSSSSYGGSRSSGGSYSGGSRSSGGSYSGGSRSSGGGGRGGRH